MKKNKFIHRSVKSQKYTFLIYNLFAYLIIFTLLGIVAFISINKIFFADAEDEILEYIDNLEEDEFTLIPQNERMTIASYNESGQLLEDLIDESLKRKVDKTIDVDALGKFDHQIINVYDEANNSRNVNYLSYIYNYEYEDITYIKIYMNVDGEVYSRNEIIKVYVICVMSIFVLSGIASYLLSRETMKPIVDSLEKQFNFVSDASHELRTPLAIVQSKIENILADSTKSVYDVSEDLAISLKEVARLKRLTDDLLILARNDDQNITLDLEYVNLTELVKQAIEPFAELSTLQNKNFYFAGENIITRADINKINQIVIILLDNALIYTNEGDNIDFTLTDNSSEIIIEVADTGIGISEHTKEHIFDRFYREDKARNRETGGNGLGLSIAKALVKAHKGKIIVNHNKPKGTKFTIVLPKK